MQSNIKVKTNQFVKMSRDIVNSKYPENLYFDAKNIRLLTHEDTTTGGFEIEKSNAKILNIGSITAHNTSEGKYIEYLGHTSSSKRLYFTTEELDHNKINTSGEQILVGQCNIIEGLILITTDGNGTDCIWKLKINESDVDNIFELELIYVRDLNLSTENIIQVIPNYENNNVYKIYFIDGHQQMYHVNINNHNNSNFDINLIDVNINNIKTIGDFNMGQPIISSYLSGGTHTAGKIQYAYNLYNVNGSQTSLSALSEFAILSNTAGGGNLDEIITRVPLIKFSNIDQKYSNIRIYSIKYTSLNVLPTISLIADEPISSQEFTYADFGGIINTISLEEFIFLGSNFIIPKSIESKNNRLFLANYKEREFDIDEKKQNIDFRAYSFAANTPMVKVADSVNFNNYSIIPINTVDVYVNSTSSGSETFPPFYAPLNNSSINTNYILNAYLPMSTSYGAAGRFLRLEFKRELITDPGYLSYKDGEIYRFAIQFYNKYGLYSTPKWITDYRINDSEGVLNLNDYKIVLEVTLKEDFYTWLNDNNNFLDENGNYDEFLKPVGYKMLRADRTINDRTVVCQGIINGMMSQIVGDTSGGGGDWSPQKLEEINRGVKLPTLMRPYESSVAPLRKVANYARIDDSTYNHPKSFVNNPGPGWPIPVYPEIQANGSKTASQWQFNNMLQMYSPEVTFNYLSNISNCRLFLKGGTKNTVKASSNYLINLDTLSSTLESRIEGGISYWDIDSFLVMNNHNNNYDTSQKHNFANDYEKGGLISKQDTDNRAKFVQQYRKYENFYNYNSLNNIQRPIYNLYRGGPDVTETGQGRSSLKNQPLYTYYNSWEVLSGDQYLKSVNTWGAKCLTMAINSSLVETNLQSQFPTISASFLHPSARDGAIIGELIIEPPAVYLSNIYGGNTIASKRRTNYIEIGEYNNISNNVTNIRSSGDTYVQDFVLTKLVKTDTEVLKDGVPQFTEIIEFKVETSIDLSNRKDISNGEWYSRLQPRYNEFQNYNLVYSQSPNLIVRRNYDYRFMSNVNKENSIITSKQKIAGEFIDSWLDFLVNNTMLLDGKYGKISNLVVNNDNMIAFQDFAVAAISVNPRVQVQGSDGIAVELGRGDVLDDYNYITTESGSPNKWAILSTSVGIFYIDINNKSLILLGKDGVRSISEEEGLHKEFLDLLQSLEIKEDSPLTDKGVVLGFNKITSDLFISVFSSEVKKTLVYNIKTQGFTSYYDYNSKFYMNNKSKLVTINHNNNDLMDFHGGKDYGNINGETVESYIEFVVNPEPEVESTFNNIEYKSECYDESNTEIKETWDEIEVKNEFQYGTSTIDRNNSRFLNRKWRISIPRNENVRDRIRNTWCNIKLISMNENNYRLLTHNISTYYIPHYKQIQ